MPTSISKSTENKKVKKTYDIGNHHSVFELAFLQDPSLLGFAKDVLGTFLGLRGFEFVDEGADVQLRGYDSILVNKLPDLFSEFRLIY